MNILMESFKLWVNVGGSKFDLSTIFYSFKNHNLKERKLSIMQNFPIKQTIQILWSDIHCEPNPDAPKISRNLQKKLDRLRKEEENKDRDKAQEIVANLLLQNPDLNVKFVVDALKNSLLSTIDCCGKLGISPRAFSRLRKKFNIEPVYVGQNSPDNLKPLKIFHRKAVKYFFTQHQINKIPQEEIEAIQLKSARSLDFPEGQNMPVKWVRNGRHFNGKLKAKIDALNLAGIRVEYDIKDNRYHLVLEGKLQILSRSEVNKLNARFKRIKSFG